jgi:UDP-N-acetylmuramoyl-tripeptide--D-alanyl-D-alanine ligase
MKAFDVVVLVVLGVGASLGALRWLRVAQREHYLRGCATRFARRWWMSRPVSMGELTLAIVFLVASVFFSGAALGVGLVVAIGPVGLSLRGKTSPLRWTRRLRTVACVTGTIVVVVTVIAGALSNLHVAIVVGGAFCLAMPVVVDGALALLDPFERSLSRRYVNSARAKLAKIKPIVVAITGSYGKTSTKLYVAHLVSGRMRVLASPQSFNNEAGLSRTVNEYLESGTEVLVAEMGTYGKGEIASMCSWLPPSISVITAIGPVHLERFKTLDETMRAKSEIAEHAETVVLNVDDERLSQFATALTQAGRGVMSCSSTRCDADVSLLRDGLEIELFVDGVRGASFSSEVFGSASLTNVACAIAVALKLGCSIAEVVDRLSGLPAVSHRLEERTGSNGATVLDDTFNSNPAGASRALHRLGELASGASRRVVVTPGMVELGSLQFDANVEFAQRAAAVATDVLIIGRTNWRALHEGLNKPSDHPRAADVSSDGPHLRDFTNRSDAVAYVASNFGPGDVVLYENDLPDHYP